MAMDEAFREKIRRRIVRRGYRMYDAVIKEPDLTEAMDTVTRKMGEHKGWTWMKVGRITDILHAGDDSWVLPDYVDEFSDITVTVGNKALAFISLDEYARRRTATGAQTASDTFKAYTICERELKFIHPVKGDVLVALELWASLSPSQLDDIGGVNAITGIRNLLPENLDKCLEYGSLGELLSPEQAKEWDGKFEKELGRLAILDDKAPIKVVRGTDAG